MATIEIKDQELVIHIHGWDKLLALRSTLTIPLAHVKAATVRPGDAQYDHMHGARLAGGYWPGSFAAGYFWVTGSVAGDQQKALARLEEARATLAGSTDPEGHYAAATGPLDEAIGHVKKGLALARVPEAARYLAFYDVHDPEKTIALDVDHGKLRRVVIQLDDETPETAAGRVLAAITRPLG